MIDPQIANWVFAVMDKKLNRKILLRYYLGKFLSHREIQ